MNRFILVIMWRPKESGISDTILKKYHKAEGLTVTDFMTHFESAIIRECGVHVSYTNKGAEFEVLKFTYGKLIFDLSMQFYG